MIIVIGFFIVAFYFDILNDLQSNLKQAPKGILSPMLTAERASAIRSYNHWAFAFGVEVLMIVLKGQVLALKGQLTAPKKQLEACN